jgi:hypothetical protein
MLRGDQYIVMVHYKKGNPQRVLVYTDSIYARAKWKDAHTECIAISPSEPEYNYHIELYRGLWYWLEKLLEE